MPINRWDYKLQLGDVFNNDDLSFEQQRDEIVRRIHASNFWKVVDWWNLEEITIGLQEAADVNEFDYVWNDFYDWADFNRVWVETISF